MPNSSSSPAPPTTSKAKLAEQFTLQKQAGSAMFYSYDFVVVLSVSREYRPGLAEELWQCHSEKPALETAQ